MLFLQLNLIGVGERIELLRKTVSGMMLALLLISMLSLAFNIQPVKASGPIYIRADGSIDPPTAPITTADNITYTLTDNINDSIVVERDNIVFDGAGYTIQGTGAYESKGIAMSGRSNVTIKNTHIKLFWYGIYLSSSNYNSIFLNNITSYWWSVGVCYGIYLSSSDYNNIFENKIMENWHGIWFVSSSNNSISRNNVTANRGFGIYFKDGSYYNSLLQNTITENGFGIVFAPVSNNNSISGNDITNNFYSGIDLHGQHNSISKNNFSNNENGIYLFFASNNTVSENNVANNRYGITLVSSLNNSIFGNIATANNEAGIRLEYSSNNSIHHNNFISNFQQTYIPTSGYSNDWDNGYPSGGNYWSDYTGVDLLSGPYQNITGSDGIGDTPYVIEANTGDNYPLMKPYAGLYDIGITNVTTSKIVVGQGYNLTIIIKILNYGINTETFNLTVYANETAIQTIRTIVLTSRNSTTITFPWNTTGFAKGKYTISAYAWPIDNESDLSDNTFTDGSVLVVTPGDIDGNGFVNYLDGILLGAAFSSTPGDTNWNANADINSDDYVNYLDGIILGANFSEHW
jgi:parallel beta-helix repeat protein